MFGKILSSFLKPVTTCRKSAISDVLQEFEFAFVAINYFRKSAGYLLTNILHNMASNTAFVHGQIHVTLSSTYLLNNENYNTCFLTI